MVVMVMVVADGLGEIRMKGGRAEGGRKKEKDDG